MSGPAIIPGKRFNPWRYVMNSVFINRFSFVALWFWFSGMALGIGVGTQNPYLFLGGFAALAVGCWPVAVWETERGENEALPRRIAAQIDRAVEALDLGPLKKSQALAGIRQIAERAAWTP